MEVGFLYANFSVYLCESSKQVVTSYQQLTAERRMKCLDSHGMGVLHQISYYKAALAAILVAKRNREKKDEAVLGHE